jgi:hypothetical protein
MYVTYGLLLIGAVCAYVCTRGLRDREDKFVVGACGLLAPLAVYVIVAAS